MILGIVKGSVICQKVIRWFLLRFCLVFSSEWLIFFSVMKIGRIVKGVQVWVSVIIIEFMLYSRKDSGWLMMLMDFSFEFIMLLQLRIIFYRKIWIRQLVQNGMVIRNSYMDFLCGFIMKFRKQVIGKVSVIVISVISVVIFSECSMIL